MTLNPGDLAPDFVLPDSDENPIRLSDFRGKTVVLYFYPRDNTPGCTKEACGFRDNYPEYQEKNIIVLGVSTDNQVAHRKFISKYQLPFPLLVDEGGKVATEYGSYGLKKFMGKEFMGIFRHTFVIDAQGRIEAIYRKVKPETHSLEILQTLEKP
ncbi:thioredoxin-dependent thiol peroxidase [Planktothrix agardhii 1806]|uniref:thioredoxin-dependent thiol peroxidase n=1 Tax=Planktothrix agardhii TaxID=1160 RepID=UPI001F469A42|nr:thioredoxin-dependent thiol peroxidase [Planktothrix agardhii]MCF3572262.1 thioredoxin-dependent thiol peroxidase [Planktothrix agardhii 1805]MCF3584847.1 thioredoxin-dependent thiol peroxidase [Planktothrix agardhii 1803]MCF3601530.1 thioredoxin-dependent thiol peroxidase [Planktothrix agardhii 1804]MCF3617560.1 thioredoxin-dependent thiol peroxidase [Planktothrix agardhii 1806]MCP9294277.1 thioredoxin-dependent thiol peroxidase [Planktothrix agardhii LY1]